MVDILPRGLAKNILLFSSFGRHIATLQRTYCFVSTCGRHRDMCPGKEILFCINMWSTYCHVSWQRTYCFVSTFGRHLPCVLAKNIRLSINMWSISFHVFWQIAYCFVLTSGRHLAMWPCKEHTALNQHLVDIVPCGLANNILLCINTWSTSCHVSLQKTYCFVLACCRLLVMCPGKEHTVLYQHVVDIVTCVLAKKYCFVSACGRHIAMCPGKEHTALHQHLVQILPCVLANNMLLCINMWSIF